MPYIAEEDREGFQHIPAALSLNGIDTAGELQFVIALAIAEYLKDKPHRYQTMNDVMGALNGANQEFYRRVVAPYETKCIEKNGDVRGYGIY